MLLRMYIKYYIPHNESEYAKQIKVEIRRAIYGKT